MIASGATGKYLSNCLLSELSEAMSSPSPAGIDTHCWFTYYDEYEKTEITKVKVIITFTNIKRKQKIVTIPVPGDSPWTQQRPTVPGDLRPQS